MEPSLSPGVANLFMVYFEAKTHNRASSKNKLWLHYVDDNVSFILEKQKLQYMVYRKSTHISRYLT